MRFEKMVNATKLRHRAETCLQTLNRTPIRMQSQHEARRVLNELQVHQVELEMQNEELQVKQVELEMQEAELRATRDNLKSVNKLLNDDIKARKQVEQALLLSEERFRELAELSSDWSWEQDEHFRFTNFSTGAGKKGSAAPVLLLGATRWEQSVDPEASDWAAHRATLQSHQPFENFEYKRLVEGMPVQWISVSGKPLFDTDGRFIGYRGTSRDISDCKKTEEALRHSRAELRDLASHQEQVKEDERKRIARDIHDDLGQNLLALRLDLSRMMAAQSSQSSPSGSITIPKEWSEGALLQIDTTIKAVRAIINDLRPAVLDLGLHAAVEWQAMNFERCSGIACEVHIDHEEFTIRDALATAMFRIVQESLTNIMRHAHASRAQIEILRKNNCISIRVADDGIGLPSDYARGTNAFGLIGIEERVHALGGIFSITSAPGKGMAIMLSIPI
jgi:PAS domain S-box-containing protein